MSNVPKLREAPESWTAALKRAEADLESGRVVDGEAVHRRIATAIGRLQNGASAAKLRKTSEA